MADLTFIGAAGIVTGSKHLLTSKGRRLLVDCGLYQGPPNVSALNDQPLPVEPSSIEAVIITHGHIDHVGYLPKLVHDGFRGTIHATPATRALMNIVLQDAAHLQQHLHHRGLHHESYSPPPFYTQDDVERTLAQTQTTKLGDPFEAAGVTITYHNAAHIVGSAFAAVQVEGRTVLFSGDVGRYDRTLLYDPDAIGAADVVICESTYGNRAHPPDATGTLERTLLQAMERGGAIVIPAFAVERTQELLFAIGSLQRSNPRITALPIYLDSPMAEAVDDLFNAFPDAHKPIPPGKTFGCENVHIAVSTDESKAINAVRGSHLILSASGMAAGGRVLHHLYNHISDPKATVLFVGYQGIGTLGNLLMSGAGSVRIFGDRLPVRAALGNITGYSAHADKNEIQRWLATCTGKPTFYAVHGDPPAASALCDAVHERFGWDAHPAKRGTTVTI